jgi:hypothetical protein
MGALKETLSAILVDATPEERARTYRFVFRIVVAVHILWACGLFAPLGLTGFAWGHDVDKKIEDAVTPIYAQLGDISTQLAKSEAVQKRILAASIASQIRDLNRARCATTDHETRRRMEVDIEDAEQEYRMLMGERYPLTACKDL